MYTQPREVVAFIATIATVSLYCTGIPICLKIIRRGNTSESSFFPLMVMFITSVLWSKYGLLKADANLVFVNFIGAVLGLVYIVIFYIYTHARKLINCQLVLGAVLLFPPLVYIRFFATNHDIAMLYMGYTCAAGSIISYGSPLSAMAEVVSKRSTASMAFPLSLANFLVSAQWCMYGFLLKDLFIQVPNAIGVMLGIIQLSLFWKFPATSKTATMASHSDTADSVLT
jgi:solute carrier family 50 protein (sugar transporter)